MLISVGRRFESLVDEALSTITLQGANAVKSQKIRALVRDVRNFIQADALMQGLSISDKRLFLKAVGLFTDKLDQLLNPVDAQLEVLRKRIEQYKRCFSERNGA